MKITPRPALEDTRELVFFTNVPSTVLTPGTNPTEFRRAEEALYFGLAHAGLGKILASPRTLPPRPALDGDVVYNQSFWRFEETPEVVIPIITGAVRSIRPDLFSIDPSQRVGQTEMDGLVQAVLLSPDASRILGSAPDTTVA